VKIIGEKIAHWDAHELIQLCTLSSRIDRKALYHKGAVDSTYNLCFANQFHIVMDCPSWYRKRNVQSIFKSLLSFDREKQALVRLSELLWKCPGNSVDGWKCVTSIYCYIGCVGVGFPYMFAAAICEERVAIQRNFVIPP